MMDSAQLREHVIGPVLDHLHLWSRSAENLLLGTAAVESAMGKYIHQINGPAIGIWQMEPTTHNDIWSHFLDGRPEVAVGVKSLAGYRWMGRRVRPEEMAGNLFYACAMTRIHYLRVPEALPDENDVDGMAMYWKQHYNTAAGAGTPEGFVSSYIRYIL